MCTELFEGLLDGGTVLVEGLSVTQELGRVDVLRFPEEGTPGALRGKDDQFVAIRNVAQGEFKEKAVAGQATVGLEFSFFPQRITALGNEIVSNGVGPELQVLLFRNDEVAHEEFVFLRCQRAIDRPG